MKGRPGLKAQEEKEDDDDEEEGKGSACVKWKRTLSISMLCVKCRQHEKNVKLLCSYT